jgi:hypothetical protein
MPIQGWHSDPMAEPYDLSAYRRVRQERGDQALIELFSEILEKPLERRDLTPEQQARRDARLAARRQQRP